MKPDRPQFHPLSPVQPGKRNYLPLIVLAVVAAAAAWNARDSLAPESSPNESSSDKESTPAPRGARANLTRLFSANDYPVDALRNEEQGATRVRLDVSRTGRVTGCTVIESSGSASLDRATCSILRRRARFEPARDVNGKVVEDTYEQKIVWQLQP